ncbi:MAG: hypothetical protein L3J93_05195 [Thermoplasmata archaeon]|nr:hypothetical protein [Thermoplasmata archaeon]
MGAAPPTVLGLPELDRDLAGCLPKSWLALLLGHTDAETSLLAKQFARTGTKEEPVIYYTTHERTEEIHTTIERIGGDPDRVRIVNLFEEYSTTVLARRLEISKFRERGLTLEDLKADTGNRRERRSYDLANRVLSDFAQIEGPFRVVFDSLDFLLEVLELPEVMTVCREARHQAQRHGGQVLVVLHSEIHERRVSGLLEEMADIVTELTTIPMGTRFEHQLSIRKVRNHPEQRRVRLLTIEKNGFALQPAAGA